MYDVIQFAFVNTLAYAAYVGIINALQILIVFFPICTYSTVRKTKGTQANKLYNVIPRSQIFDKQAVAIYV